MHRLGKKAAMTLAGIVGKVHGSLHLRLGGQLVIGTKPGATGRLIPSFLAGTSLEKGIAYACRKRTVHMAADAADPCVDLSVIILV